MDQFVIAINTAVSGFLVQMATQHALFMLVILLMGFLRSILKPLFTFLHSYVESTVDPADDKLLEKVETSKGYKILVFILDYVASVKIEKPKQ